MDGHAKAYTGKGRLQNQFVSRQSCACRWRLATRSAGSGGRGDGCGSAAADLAVRLQRLELATACRTQGARIRRHCLHDACWPSSLPPLPIQEEFRKRRIPLPEPLRTVTLEGRVAERKATRSTGCPVCEIRLRIDRQRLPENRSGQPRKPIQWPGPRASASRP